MKKNGFPNKKFQGNCQFLYWQMNPWYTHNSLRENIILYPTSCLDTFYIYLPHLLNLGLINFLKHGCIQIWRSDNLLKILPLFLHQLWGYFKPRNNSKGYLYGHGRGSELFLWQFMSSSNMCMKKCYIKSFGGIYSINICGVAQQHLGELDGDLSLYWGFGGVNPISGGGGGW